MLNRDPFGHLLDTSRSNDLRNYDHLYGETAEPLSGDDVLYTRRDVFYAHRVELYQDGIGACAGFSAAGWLAATGQDGIDDGWGLSIYYDAQRIDEWAGESYEGTSINAVCKVLRARGYIDRWEWVTTFADYRRALREGPLLRGWEWTESMSRPNAQGIITDVGGESLGGHATLVTGDLDSFGDITTHRNWWQRAPHELWGHNGNFYLPRALDEQKFEEMPEAALLYPTEGVS